MGKKRTGEALKDLFKREVEFNRSAKALKGQRAKAFKRQGVKTLRGGEEKPRHTIYLSPKISKKLRIYAAEHRMRLNEVIEKLINENL